MILFQDFRDFAIHPRSLYKYLQIHYMLQCALGGSNGLIVDILKLFAPNLHRKDISFLYQLLSKPAWIHKMPSMEFWGCSLNFDASHRSWHYATYRPLKLSKCMPHWEAAKKFFINGALLQSGLNIFFLTIPQSVKDLVVTRVT